MARFVLLDAGIIGLACANPMLSEVRSCLAWIDQLSASGSTVVIPEITCYEVRRELIRLGASTKLRRLDDLRRRLLVVQVDETDWTQAAEKWALVRKAGTPTASPDALDADAILAAVTVAIIKPRRLGDDRHHQRPPPELVSRHRRPALAADL